MGQLEQFYTVSKNSRTSLYAKIFLAVRNHSICLPKINPELSSYLQNLKEICFIG